MSQIADSVLGLAYGIKGLNTHRTILRAGEECSAAYDRVSGSQPAGTAMTPLPSGRPAVEMRVNHGYSRFTGDEDIVTAIAGEVSQGITSSLGPPCPGVRG